MPEGSKPQDRPLGMSRIRNDSSIRAIDENIHGHQYGLPNEDLVSQHVGAFQRRSVLHFEQDRAADASVVSLNYLRIKSTTFEPGRPGFGAAYSPPSDILTSPDFFEGSMKSE